MAATGAVAGRASGRLVAPPPLAAAEPDAEATPPTATAAELAAAGRGFGNGRHMRNLFEKAIRKHAVRLCLRKREWTKDELSELNSEDLA